MNHADFPLHDRDTAPDAAAAFDRAETIFGMVPNLTRKMATSPALAQGYLDLTSLFDRCSLSAQERGVVLLTVSRFHGCDYCMAAHSMTGRMTGLPDAEVDALREDRPLPDARLEALRRFVHAMLEGRGWVDASDLAAFRHAGFGEQQVLDVILGIGLKTLSNYTNHIAGTPVDTAFEHERWTAPGIAPRQA
ncbi:carboxymuconolactone decarboxylase family protein [Thioalkalivibrio paradoxus]|uniref:Carboxymuconolactone decarboxylase n=1 Tax=Thioalkalivibrio paradoxus ARh 1 TaxID=713585 RepID=W0DK44_9GAMM|nr:carboxymuconolactone decarboxylase family protein [Thioalkalivibrio paradoxus]AHE98974.1 carboxymuconolactone decarboxylase [Thioalkalivibrio paradoxus ARh 1]